MGDECAIGGNYSALLKIYFGKSGRSDGQWSNLENKITPQQNNNSTP